MKTLSAIILGLFLITGTTTTEAQVAVSVTVAPPVIPVYTQPPCPVDGYLWTPGYWAYDYDDGVYYWVPGVWLAPPTVGFLWTPGYWGFDGGHYFWHGGYWGPHVGFYGGINYGFGYVGTGFWGGRWEGNSFRYNTTVWHVNNTVIHNTYTASPAAGPGSRAAFNGKGGITAQPNASEQAAMKENHVAPTSSQRSHEQAMSKDKSQWASVNKGKPGTASMSTVGGQKFNAGGSAADKPVAHTATTSHTTSHTNAPVNHTAAPASHSSTPATSHTTAPANHTVNTQHTPAPQQHMVAPQHSQNMHPMPRGGGGMHGGGGGGEKHR